MKDSGNLQPGTSVTKPNFKRYPVQQRPAHLPQKIQFNRTSHSSQSPAMPKKIGKRFSLFVVKVIIQQTNVLIFAWAGSGYGS